MDIHMPDLVEPLRRGQYLSLSTEACHARQYSESRRPERAGFQGHGHGLPRKEGPRKGVGLGISRTTPNPTPVSLCPFIRRGFSGMGVRDCVPTHCVPSLDNTIA